MSSKGAFANILFFMAMTICDSLIVMGVAAPEENSNIDVLKND